MTVDSRGIAGEGTACSGPNLVRDFVNTGDMRLVAVCGLLDRVA